MPDFVDPFAAEAGGDEEFALPLDEAVSNFNAPADDYEMYCTDLVKSVSEAGNPMYEWTFRTTGRRKVDNFQKVDGENADKEFKTFTALTPKALWKLEELAVAMGIGEAGKPGTVTKSGVLGVLVIGTLEDSVYKGKPRTQLGTIVAHPKGAGQKVQPAGVPS